MCFFKLITLFMVVMKTEMRIFNNNRIKYNEQLMLVVLNCTLLYDRNDGWTVSCPYLVVCCKNIYPTTLFKRHTLRDKTCYMILEHFY